MEKKVLDRNNEKGKTGHAEALALLQSLPMRDRNEIRGLFEEYAGTVDTEVEFECSACSHEWKADMDVSQPGFFFPSGA